MIQSKEIYEGFKNLVKSKLLLSNKEVKTMAKLRYDICKDCTSRNRMTGTCRECGCFLAAKTRSEASSCPLNHWNSIH